VIFTWYFY